MKAKLNYALTTLFPIEKKEYEWNELLLFISFIGLSIYALVVVDMAFYNYLTS
ncbi:MAG: hypothetical protein ACXVP0_10065 [Bacteroidia bacterium]